MRFNGIAESFDAMAFCDESGVGKTKPRVFEMAAERLGVEPEECLVFEDLPQAIESARSIGMTACAVMEPYDHQDSELAAKVADFSIESFEQLVANAQ